MERDYPHPHRVQEPLQIVSRSPSSLVPLNLLLQVPLMNPGASVDYPTVPALPHFAEQIRLKSKRYISISLRLKGRVMRITTRDEGWAHVRRLWVGGKAVSRVGIVDRGMRVGSSVVRMGGVAGLWTEREHRMRGYARALMNDAVGYMGDRGYDVSMLFGIEGFYHRFGYAPCMAEHELNIPTKNAERAQGRYQVREFREGDTGDILQIYQENNRDRSCTILRAEEAWRGFRMEDDGYEPLKAFVVEDGGEVAAYAAFRERRDRLVVAEVGWRREDAFGTLLREFSEIAIRMRSGSIHVHLPAGHPFAEFCQAYGCEVSSWYPWNGDGMLRIIDLESLFRKIRAELGGRVRRSGLGDYSGSLTIETDLGAVTLEIDGGNVAVNPGGGGGSLLRLPQARLAQLVVGYRSLRSLLLEPGVEARGDTQRLVDALFPRGEPYVWMSDRF